MVPHMNATFTPWKRYGHDRLYVAVDDRKIGYRDHATGDDHLENTRDAALLTALVDAHLAGAATPAIPPIVEAAPAAPSFERPGRDESGWTDLALNVPGQSARERAVEECEARKVEYPVRARLGRLLNVHTDERAWRIGADGEEATGAQLEKLAREDPRWRVFHAVPVGERGSDIVPWSSARPASSRSTPSTTPARRSGSAGPVPR
jgi:hypothetical protein